MGSPDRKWAKRLLDNTSQGLIALHVLLALYFVTDSLLPMFLVNLVCAVCGVIGLYLLKKGQIRAHILILYLSELIHLGFSVVVLGWSAGFQLPLVGLTCMVFLGEYLGRSLKLPYIPALPLGLVNLAVYVLAYPHFFYRPGLAGLEQFP